MRPTIDLRRFSLAHLIIAAVLGVVSTAAVLVTRSAEAQSSGVVEGFEFVQSIEGTSELVAPSGGWPALTFQAFVQDGTVGTSNKLHCGPAATAVVATSQEVPRGAGDMRFGSDVPTMKWAGAGATNGRISCICTDAGPCIAKVFGQKAVYP